MTARFIHRRHDSCPSNVALYPELKVDDKALGIDPLSNKEEEMLDTRRIKRTKSAGSAGDDLPHRQRKADRDERERKELAFMVAHLQDPPGQNEDQSKGTSKRPEGKRNEHSFQDADNMAGDSQLGAAGLESRMKHVRDWIKKRNPSMISPSLTETSNNTHSDRRSLSRRNTLDNSNYNNYNNNDTVGSEAPLKKQKRKAHRQLVPITNPKRIAPEASLHSRAQGLREALVRTPVKSHQVTAVVHPQSSDTVPATATHLQPIRRHSSLRSPPVTRNSSSDAPLMPPDWSRFQRPHRVLKQSRSLPSLEPSGPSATPPYLTKRTPQKLNGRLSIGTLGGIADDGRDGNASTAAISPLIKLRQSQLLQHQQEDFLGIKHGSDTDALRRRQQRQEEEGAFRFNDALDAWEREDDETLALNAAREATEAEVRGQQRSAARSQDALSFSSTSEQEAENDDRGRKKPLFSTAPSFLQSETAMAAPASSLLRTVPFHGESSRRPVPDLHSNSKQAARKLSRPEIPSNVNNGKSNGHIADQHRSQPIFRGAVSLANSRQLKQQQERRSARREEEEEKASVRRERHPGLYTPSKKNRYLGLEDFDTQSLHKSTPTSMSRYIQLSGLTDDEEDSA
ncbi:hypothetical protein BGZ72_009921 [Mortierella alpina]|nr:hypothetical protein BGZ72_009921 [Mortierella alpina]